MMRESIVDWRAVMDRVEHDELSLNVTCVAWLSEGY